jgi:ATP-dependent helicase HrpA
MAVEIDNLKPRLAEAWGVDRHRLSRRWSELEASARAGRPVDRALERFRAELDVSIARRASRLASVPAKIEYDESLPIAAHRQTIREALADTQLLVVCGETGSGKSTQLPLICLEAGRGVDGMIGHTQPRRIAARSIATRVAQELKVPLGGQVGFQVRFTDATGPETLIKLMTDGILLTEIQSDRFLNRYDTLILDEAHERSLNVDFLIGFLRNLLPRRRDLKVILTSATIDAQRFSAHFAAAGIRAPILEVSGRSYPVEIRHRPPQVFDEDEEPDWTVALLSGIEEAVMDGPGDILVFLPTERDIHELTKILRKHPSIHTGTPIDILPLYARLPTAEQNRVFSTGGKRRIVLATNVAESSLTVPAIRYVVDPGTARISRYAPKSKVQRLPVEPISRASADQRAGRCGRVGPGVCIRLFSRDDFAARDAYTLPEIQRTNLAAVILRGLALKFGRIDEFPFLDPPRPESIRDGYKTLFELGAVDDAQQLTPLGTKLSKLPVDPRIGRIILAGDDENCLHEVLILAAALELQDPRERPFDKQQAADQAHEQFCDEESDFVSLLKVWDFYHAQRDEVSRSQLKRVCQKSYLSYNRMREWVDLHQQLLRLVTESGLKLRPRRDDRIAMHRALVTGLVSNVAFRPEGNDYLVAGGGQAVLWPGSGCYARKPKWIVAAEQVETSRRFLRTVADIDPGWIERLVPHLIQKSWSEAHWDRTAQSARAFEKVTLFGLTIVPRRRVQYGPIDPKVSRELFIRHALIAGECDLTAPFYQHNHLLLGELQEMQTRSRRGGLLLGEDAQFAFYDARLPPDIYDIPRLEKFRREAERTNTRLLHFRPEDLLSPDVSLAGEEHFPARLSLGGLDLLLSYTFDPSSSEDGITVRLAPAALNQIDSRRLGWLVPGLLDEKVMAVLRGLPKALRVRFVPVPETARKVAALLKFGVGDFAEELATAVRLVSGIDVPRETIAAVDLPTHLRIHIAIVDESGKVLVRGQNLDELRREWNQKAAAQFDQLSATHRAWHRDNVQAWDFGDLPEDVPLRSGTLTLRGHVAVQDTHDAARLRLVDTAERARRESRAGVRRLLQLACRKEINRQLDYFPDLKKHLIVAAALPDRAAQFREDLGLLLLDRAAGGLERVPRRAAEFAELVETTRRKLGEGVQEVVPLMGPLLNGYQAALGAVEKLSGSLFAEVRADIRDQLAELVAPHFLVRVPFAWLAQYPRYFHAMQVRVLKVKQGGLDRDLQMIDRLKLRRADFAARVTAHERRGVNDPELQGFRWLLEEYRVSLFAQELRTAVPVSEKRLDEQWARVQPAV